ncbi:MAG: pirin family protein [Gammaproteobacteria bacterium]|nr:pirin family protein [Gammaproteobacteria bacterium]
MQRYVTKKVLGIPTTDGAGVELTRVIGQANLDMLDPFIMLDAFRSNDPNEYLAGFPSHPHRGFETVTYLLNGKMHHKDNAGNEGIIEPGGIQWMTAGKGIIHSEMPEQEEGLLEGFQLWINLPASHKMSEPKYQEFAQNKIPVEHREGSEIKVIVGTTSTGTTGPVIQPLTNPMYLDVKLNAETEFTETLENNHNAFIYGIEGSVLVEDSDGKPLSINKDELAILSLGKKVKAVASNTGARFLLLSANPINEPVARGGPFVMNTKEEITQAFNDYQRGRF